MEKRGIVLQLILVVCAAEHCVEVDVAQLFDPLLNRLSPANDDLQAVLRYELLNAIGAETHECALHHLGARVLAVLLLRVFIDRIAPEQVQHHFLLRAGRGVVLDFEGTGQLLNVVESSDVLPDAAGDAKYAVVDESCEGKVLEDFVYLIENRVGLLDAVVEPRGTFKAQTLEHVDERIFVHSPQNVDVFGELQLQSEERADHLERVLAQIAIVSQEQVVECFNVAQLGVVRIDVGHPVLLKKLH